MSFMPFDVAIAELTMAPHRYNAVIFTSQTVVNYNLVFVTRPFLSGAPFSNATANNKGGLSRLDILSLQDLARRDALVNLTSADCLGRLSSVFESEYKSVLLVTDIDSPAGSALIQTARASSSLPRSGTIRGSLPDAALDERAVQFCLAQRADAQTCGVSMNGSLLGIVSLLNLVSVISVAIVLFKPSFDPLVSLGDAVASFLQRPDPTTRGSCLMTKSDVWQGRWGFHEPKYWIPRDLFWLRVPSFPRWCLPIFFWTALTALAALAFAFAVSADPTGPLSGYGSASARAVYLLPPSTPASAAALVASLPQLLLGALYLATNSLLTTYYLSHESSLFALGEPRPLRVSSLPEGHQTTSLYLTLPRPWSWYLSILFAAMAFVLSQSVFVVAIRLVDPPSSSSSSSSSSYSPSTTPPPALVGLGLSTAALLTLLTLLLLLATSTLVPGLRRCPASPRNPTPAEFDPTDPDPAAAPVGNPLALPGGACSAVIAARCHPVPGEPAPWRARLVWGVVRRGAGGADMGRCAYTGRAAAPLDVGASYA